MGGATGRLAGKNVLVVGATSGMGRATALLFAREGAGVVAAGRRAALLHELGAQIAAETGRACATVPCDVRDREQIAAMLRFSREQLGRLDTIIYNSGVNIKDRALDRLTPELWDDVLSINLTGAFHTTHLAVPILREQGGGLIIYVSSIGARRPDVSGVAYQASKRGLDGLAGGTATEERAHGIRTAVIYPGLCDTDLLLQRPVPTPEDQVRAALQPEDVAETCLFLAALPERCSVPELVLVPSRLPWP